MPDWSFGVQDTGRITSRGCETLRHEGVLFYSPLNCQAGIFAGISMKTQSFCLRKRRHRHTYGDYNNYQKHCTQKQAGPFVCMFWRTVDRLIVSKFASQDQPYMSLKMHMSGVLHSHCQCDFSFAVKDCADLICFRIVVRQWLLKLIVKCAGKS